MTEKQGKYRLENILLPCQLPQHVQAECVCGTENTPSEENDHKNTVSCCETSIVDNEERNHENFVDPWLRLLGFARDHPKHIIETDDHILRPEEEHDGEDIPSQKENAEHRIEINQDESQNGRRLRFDF